jgi:hypothetical protein
MNPGIPGGILARAKEPGAAGALVKLRALPVSVPAVGKNGLEPG